MAKTKNDDTIGEENLKKTKTNKKKRETGVSEENKKKIGILVFTVLAGTLAIFGFSFFAQALSFDALKPADSGRGNGKWDVAFVDMTEEGRTGNAAELSTPTFNNLRASFHVTLNSPGDEIKYSFTIANRGNIDAKLNSINMIPPNKDDDPFLYYVEGIKIGDELNVGEKAKMTITIRYNDNYKGSQTARKDAEVILYYSQKVD